MSGFTNIVKKELRELLTKSTVIPIILMAVMFGLLGNVFGGIGDEVAKHPLIGLVDQDPGVLSDVAVSSISKHSDIKYNGTSVSDGIAAAESQGCTALIVIPSNFTSSIMGGQRGQVQIFWIMRGAGIADTISSTSVESILSLASAEVSSYLIEHNTSLDSALVMAPAVAQDTTMFKDTELPGISPSEISTVMQGQSTMVPIIIMMIVIMGGSTVISSMGLEKENKTLETLLTLPVNRSSIIAGKLVASAIVGLLMAGIYMVGFNFYMASLTGSSSVDLASFGLTLGSFDYVLIALSLFTALLAALALCMVIGTFATNYKSAQTLTMPVTILAMIPMFIIMMKDFNTLPMAGKAVVFAIPFSHPMMAFRSLMFDDYALVIAGIVYGAVFSAAMIAIAVWIFKTDRLLTGRIGRKAEGKGKPRSLIGLLLSARKG